MNTGRRNTMSPMEVETLTNTIRGMTEEQLKLIVRNIPVRLMCEEIANRHEVIADKITSITSIMGNV